MSTAENGNAANISAHLPAAVAVTGASNASPIVITCASHSISTNDLVHVTAVQGNTSANGQWAATFIDSTHFSLQGSSGNGAWTSGGSVQSLAVGPTFAVPQDSVDLENASSVNVPFNALADRTAFIAGATGGYKIANIFQAGVNNDSLAVWSTLTGVLNVYATTGVAIASISGLLLNDYVDITLSTTALVVNTNGPIYGGVALMIASAVPGGSLGPYLKLADSGQAVAESISGSVYFPVTLRGGFTCTPGPWQDQTVGIYPGFISNLTSLGATVSLLGDYLLTAIVYRPTGMPQ